MAQQTELVEGVPIDAITTLLLTIRDMGGFMLSVTTQTKSEGCQLCRSTTTTTISFEFPRGELPTSPPPPPPTPRQCAPIADSLDYDDSVISVSDSVSDAPQSSGPNGPPSLTAVGAPGLTPAAALRWYAVFIGTNVGVFQGCETIKPFIEGVSGNKSVGYATRELANAAFSNALKQGKVMLVEQ